MTDAALAVHRAFYDALETADIDLMASLWVDDPEISCVHPGGVPVRGVSAVLRSWTVLMANVGYMQFFLTDVEQSAFPRGAADPQTIVVTCTENILSGDGLAAVDFVGIRTNSTSVLVRDGGTWKFWSRHVSPVADTEEID